MQAADRGRALAEEPLDQASLLYSRGLADWYRGRLDQAEAWLGAGDGGAVRQRRDERPVGVRLAPP
jgi:hypothetical protein